ncbi:MAG: hypothetical protein HGB32_04635 [Geobacteraceae bacterium]|nr:hypothetical protein [Geobacteraceae bacterium]
MKAKSSYTGLESVSLSFSTKSSDLFKLPGNNATMGIINDLFDSGDPEEARKQLRSALADISQNLDKILAEEGRKKDQNNFNELVDTASLELNLGH